MQTKKINLWGIERAEYYESGALKNCMLGQKNEIKTPYGTLVPKYGPETERSRFSPSAAFYENGALQSMTLEKQTMIKTPVGEHLAEFVSFYESGALKRFFPLNGKISGFWGEEDEGKLCEALHFKLDCGSFNAKIIGMYFYESGKLKSMTLWPGEDIILKTNCGLLPVRNGFSLYESGNVKSVEPAYEITIASPIGNITIFDETACGINGDENSLQFSEEGNISSFKTSRAKIAAHPIGKSQCIIEPALVPDSIDPEEMIKVPMTIILSKDSVTINTEKNTYEFDLTKTTFTVINDIPGDSQSSSCGDCSSCSACK